MKQIILFYNDIPCLNNYVIYRQSVVQVFAQSGTSLVQIKVAANWPSLLPVYSQQYHIEVNIVRRDTVLIPPTRR